MEKLYIAIDFDGTIVEENFPYIGKMKPFANKVINRLHYAGHQIIINTCRVDDMADQAREFLVNKKIHFDVFNENHPELIEKFGNDCRKLGADIYIDDKSIFCQNVDWLEIEYELEKNYERRK